MLIQPLVNIFENEDGNLTLEYASILDESDKIDLQRIEISKRDLADLGALLLRVSEDL